MPQKDRTTIYESVTHRIVGELEQGRVPWVQPWGAPAIDTPLGLPLNGSTGRTYSGINILILWGAAIDHERRTQTWLTFRQALALGGCVRKGEKGTTVVYADRFVPEKEKARAKEAKEDPQAIPFLKRYTVFNADQCDGLPDDLFVGAAPLRDCEAIPRAEALIAATGADFRIGGDRAFYVPSEDFVQVPPQPAFRAQINYYRTCFHELGHWTGHGTRLARSFKGRFESKPYAREELVAEMASAFVCATLRIVPTVRHADYLATWLDLLREDDRAIFHAASLASKAADFLLAFQSDGVTVLTDDEAAA
ncbi:zincin-like metallopeptidase domain-containing protein [uncultured Erythrobacter sp.]|uniref:ArdC family protein n=1 Tax=uncultured Erythrobacter sp. TaxID=263913 RepID=UPI00260C6BA2|nr:zincin-like metallopeptidase domain-containing protein [uncultured Erythrobacter sp.]